jgi:hypothetical protein
MTNEKDKISNIRNKLDFYLREKIKVHVDKIDKFFFNGYIVKKIEDNVYLIQDDVLGPQHLFLNEIYKIDTYREPKERPKFNNF